MFSLERFRHRLASLDALPQFAALGIAAGALTGLIIVLFRQAIEIPLRFWLPDGDPENFESLSMLARFLAPVLGALAIALIFTLIPGPHRKIGVGHVLERLHFNEGHMPTRNMLAQFVIGVINLVSGQSAGREGPAIHLGATASSLLGRRLKLPNNSIRVLVGCGCAAAISASFNTPIAGVIFAMEVIIMEYTIAGFTPVILAAVSSTVVIRAVYGADPAFNIPQVAIQSLWDIPFVIALGFIVGAAAALFNFWARYCTRYNHFNIWLRAGFVGIATGTIALALPEVMGIGYDTVDLAITGQIGLALLLTITLAKLLTTATAVGLGMPFGLIGPALVCGATLGSALGWIGIQLMPEQASDMAMYGILGMVAMMGAVLQAPLAALMALLELTGNAHIILPGMLVVVVASITARSLFKQAPIFQILLTAAGINIKHTPVSQALRRTGVLSLMNTNLARLPRISTLSQAQDSLSSNPDWIVIEVDNAPRLVMPAPDLARYLESDALAEQGETQQDEDDEFNIDLFEIPAKRRDLASIHRQATLQEALKALQQSGVAALYVAHINAPMMTSVQGVITQEDIENHYL